MVITLAKTPQEIEICKRSLENLRKFPLFDNSHSILAHENSNGFSFREVWINRFAKFASSKTARFRLFKLLLENLKQFYKVLFSYWTAPSQAYPDQTEFSIQKINEIGYVLSINIQNSVKKGGYGRHLYQVIENIFRNYNCEKIRTTPSGGGKFFWPTLGFAPIGNGELEKVLKKN